MTNRQFDNELRNSKADIDKVKFQHKNWVKNFPQQMKESSDTLVRAFINGDTPLWGSMSIYVDGKKYRIG